MFWKSFYVDDIQPEIQVAPQVDLDEERPLPTNDFKQCYSPEKWLHNWIATGPNKSKKLTRLTSPAHTTHGKVRINPLEIWVVMQRASKQRSSRCHHAITVGCGAIQWMDATKCVVCLSFVTSLHSNYLYHALDTFSATCHSWHGLWSHVGLYCFSFKLCRVYCVSAI